MVPGGLENIRISASEWVPMVLPYADLQDNGWNVPGYKKRAAHIRTGYRMYRGLSFLNYCNMASQQMKEVPEKQ